MASEQTVVYLKADRDIEVTKPDVTIGDLFETECTDKMALAKIRSMKVIRFPKTGRKRNVISVLRVISCIHEKYPEIKVDNIGETDIIVTYEDQKTPSMAWHVIKTLFVTILVFCGAAFSIMAFNNDVNVTRLFGQIYELATGNETDGFTILEITYSIGLTAGILIFFNHFGKKRFTVDPTPMEVQMRLYENDIQTTLIENAAREGGEISEGGSSTGSSGGNRT